MKKIKLILLQLVIAFVLISTSVYAAVNTTIALSIGEATVFRGDTVDVILSLKDVEANKKIQSVAGYINYDENVIEAITVDSIKKSNDNKVTIGNETLSVEDLTDVKPEDMPTTSAYVAFNGNPTTNNDARIVIDFQNGIDADTDLLTIKFKVKETATIGQVEKAISYTMFVITAGSEESEEITKDIKLTVKAGGSNPTGNTENNVNENKGTNTATNTNTNKATNTNTNKATNTNTNKATNTNTNKATNTNTNKVTNTNTNKATNTNTNKAKAANNSVDNTISNSKIPAAGAKVIIIPAIILIILAYVSYNRYIKYKNI